MKTSEIYELIEKIETSKLVSLNIAMEILVFR